MLGPAIITLFFLLANTTLALADGDPIAGEKVFKKCRACHDVGENAKNKVGPALNGVYRQPAGQAADFKYSSKFVEKAVAGLVWDEANLTTFLEKPKDFIPGTKMSFKGIKKDKDIADLLAFLSQY